MSEVGTRLDEAALKVLLERVEKAEGPDRELDCEIARHLLGMTATNRMAEFPDEVPIYDWLDPVKNTKGSEVVMVREFTDSIDAAVALVEKMLPGEQYYLSHIQDAIGADWEAEVGLNGRAHSKATPALALIAALLRALIACGSEKQNAHEP